MKQKQFHAKLKIKDLPKCGDSLTIGNKRMTFSQEIPLAKTIEETRENIVNAINFYCDNVTAKPIYKYLIKISTKGQC